MENKCKMNPWNSIVFRLGVLFIVFLTAVGVISTWRSFPFAIPFLLVGSIGAILYIYKKVEWPNC